MPKTLYWMQAGGCGGDTLSFLNAESPNVIEFLSHMDIEVLWHPSMSATSPKAHLAQLEAILNGEQALDIFCLEGAVIEGPDGTGMFETHFGRPKRDYIRGLCERAAYTLALGTCASFGGVTAACGIEARGLQFDGECFGGFLGRDFRSRAGEPVINLPGCPCHPTVIVDAITTVAQGTGLTLNRYNAPTEWYNLLVHQGCTRNEYHEYRVEETDFGQKGCLFFHMGCQGPLASGPCNKILWNRRSCKTRVGVPCFGCVNPDFPREDPFFQTPNIEGLPIKLPSGVDRAHYLAYKSMAAAAAPGRLTSRKTEV